MLFYKQSGRDMGKKSRVEANSMKWLSCHKIEAKDWAEHEMNMKTESEIVKKNHSS